MWLSLLLVVAIAVPFFVAFFWLFRKLANRQSGMAFGLLESAAKALGLEIVPPDPLKWRIIRGRIDGYDVSISRGHRGKLALMVAA